MYKKMTLGMPVRCQDGEAGHLERMIFDTQTQDPAYLVVRHGLLSPRDIVVPARLVFEVTEQAIVLNTTVGALKTFPDYEMTVKSPAPSEEARKWSDLPPLLAPWVEAGPTLIRQRTVPEHTTDLKQGMTVYDPYGTKLGEIEGVIMDEHERRASHLILRQGLPIDADRRLIPVDLIDFVVRSDVYLLITSDHVQGLPTLATYQPG
jgi:sporulation protein YlmC with PRC-barrel domain